jgi:hypothetical protein
VVGFEEVPKRGVVLNDREVPIFSGRSEPAFEECRIRDGEDAAKALAAMGLRVSYFDRAVSHGIDRASRVLPVHPLTYKGQVMWAETLGELRTVLIEVSEHFKIGRTHNYETVYHAELTYGVAVVGGDAFTGERAFKPPKTARKRGPITAERINRNVKNIQGQLKFDFAGMEEPAEDEQLETWFLLMNAREDAVYRELSCPLTLGPDGKIGRWRERILMPPVPLQGVEIGTIVDGPDDGDLPQVHVSRK